MSLVAWNPARELDALFSRVNRPLGSERGVWGETMGSADWMPAVDIRETEDAYQIDVDLPEMRPEDVQVTFHDGVLAVSGERKYEQKTEGKVHRLERRYGRFSRSFRLPESADESRIEAQARDGVLRLRIPKREAVKPRTIDVQVS